LCLLYLLYWRKSYIYDRIKYLNISTEYKAFNINYQLYYFIISIIVSFVGMFLASMMVSSSSFFVSIRRLTAYIIQYNIRLSSLSILLFGSIFNRYFLSNSFESVFDRVGDTAITFLYFFWYYLMTETYFFMLAFVSSFKYESNYFKPSSLPFSLDFRLPASKIISAKS
jgi:hypothetical protein